jgi:exodeoxyribonuclease VII large subunit
MTGLPLKPAPGSVIAVGALNRMVRDILEHALPLLWVRGEVSNFSCAQSGHCYFTLKDASAQVRCAMFRSRARLLDWLPQNGMQVEVRASATLFEARGEFQLTVEAIRRAGVGALYEAFERLKTRLAAEGLFAHELKRSLPSYPRCVGIVTSPQAAALRDVLTVLARRMPGLPVVVYPTPVQGAGAAQSIVRALGLASSRAECDVLILCRGGGSIEDLWAFNEEAVARALRASVLPVVVGVGHETDFTIADFAADVRAPTPSAAAELVSPDRERLCAQVGAIEQRMRRALGRTLDTRWQAIDYLARRLVDPRERLRIEARHLQQLAARWAQAGLRAFSAGTWQLTELRRRLVRCTPDSQRAATALQRSGLRLGAAARHGLERRAARLDSLGARLQAMNPHAVLARGYAIATDGAGRIVTDAATVAVGCPIHVQLARGALETTVERASAASDGPGDASVR